VSEFPRFGEKSRKGSERRVKREKELTLIRLVFFYQDDVGQSGRLEPLPHFSQTIPHVQIGRSSTIEVEVFICQPVPFHIQIPVRIALPTLALTTTPTPPSSLFPRRQLVLQVRDARTQHAHPKRRRRRRRSIQQPLRRTKREDRVLVRAVIPHGDEDPGGVVGKVVKQLQG
jgi:hypothetical protein